MSRLLAIVAALVAAALLAACGGEDEGSPPDAAELLATAFSTPVESGRMSLTADVQVDGIAALGDGIQLRLSGPFTRTAADLDVTLGGLGPALTGGFTLTEDNVYVGFAGRSYELGEELVEELRDDVEERTGRDAESLSLEALGIDVERWLRDPQVQGDEEVGGEPVTRIAAGVDAARVLADLAGFAETTGGSLKVPAEDVEALAGLVEDSQVEVDVSKRDGTIRRVALEVEFEVPEAARGEFGGAEGGAVKVDVTLAEVGEPQRIEPPEDARPLGDLLRQFGLGAELLQQ